MKKSYLSIFIIVLADCLGCGGNVDFSQPAQNNTNPDPHYIDPIYLPVKNTVDCWGNIDADNCFSTAISVLNQSPAPINAMVDTQKTMPQINIMKEWRIDPEITSITSPRLNPNLQTPEDYNRAIMHIPPYHDGQNVIPAHLVLHEIGKPPQYVPYWLSNSADDQFGLLEWRQVRTIINGIELNAYAGLDISFIACGDKYLLGTNGFHIVHRIYPSGKSGVFAKLDAPISALACTTDTKVAVTTLPLLEVSCLDGQDCIIENIVQPAKVSLHNIDGDLLWKQDLTAPFDIAPDKIPLSDSDSTIKSPQGLRIAVGAFQNQIVVSDQITHREYWFNSNGDLQKSNVANWNISAFIAPEDNLLFAVSATTHQMDGQSINTPTTLLVRKDNDWLPITAWQDAGLEGNIDSPVIPSYCSGKPCYIPFAHFLSIDYNQCNKLYVSDALSGNLRSIEITD